MEAAFGRLHKGGRAAFDGAPTFVDSIVGDGEAANIAKTYAYTYQMCPYFHICHLSYYLPSVSSVEMSYSPTTSMSTVATKRFVAAGLSHTDPGSTLFRNSGFAAAKHLVAIMHVM